MIVEKGKTVTVMPIWNVKEITLYFGLWALFFYGDY